MKSISVTCVNCGHNMSIPETLLGKQGKCPACGQITTIRASNEIAQQDFSQQPLPQQPLPQQPLPQQPLPQQPLPQQPFATPNIGAMAFTRAKSEENKRRVAKSKNVARTILDSKFGGLQGARSHLSIGNDRYPNLTKYLAVLDILIRIIFMIGIVILLVALVVGMLAGLYLMISNPFGYYAGGGAINITVVSGNTITDGDYFNIEVGGLNKYFEFDVGDGVRPEDYRGQFTPVIFSKESSSAEVAQAIGRALEVDGDFVDVTVIDNVVGVGNDDANEGIYNRNVLVKFKDVNSVPLRYYRSTFLFGIYWFLGTPIAAIIYYFLLVWYRIVALAGIEFIRVFLDTEENTRN